MAYTPKTWTTGETITAAELNAIEQAASAASAAADTANTGLGSKVNSSTYTAGLAGKADLVSGTVPDAQLPTRLSTTGLNSAIDARGTANGWGSGGSGGGLDVTDVGYDLVLLIGQSNMVGHNTDFDSRTDPADGRIFSFEYNGPYVDQIVGALDPLTHPTGPDGVGPGMPFARWYAGMVPVNRKILLVPAAASGTPLTPIASGTWNPNVRGDLYDSALTQAQQALTAAGAHSRFVAALWLQGESDSGSAVGGVDTTQGVYAAILDQLIARLRADLTVPNLPFVVGGMAPWTISQGAAPQAIAAAHADTPNRDPYTAYAAGPDLSATGLHYTAAGQRILGRSMSTAYRTALTNTTPTVPTKPGQLTGLAAGTTTSSTVPLTWTAVSGAAYYVVDRSTDGGTTWAPVASGVTGTSYTVTGLTASTAYKLRATAANGGGYGTPSTALAATTAAGGGGSTAPTQVTGLTAGTPTSSGVSLSWTAPASNGGAAITDYVVQYRVTGAGSWSTFADGTSTTTSTTVTGLTASTSYDFQVAAVNSVGTGTYSATATATTASSGGGTTDFGPTLTTLRGAPTYTTGKFGNALSGGVLNNAAGVGAVTNGTVELWLKINTTGTQVALLGSAGDWIGSNNGQAHGGGLSGTSIQDNLWHHVAITYASGGTVLFVDGAQAASGSDQWPFASRITIGGFGDNSSYDFAGQIDEVRISNVIRYTGTFTPATTSFTTDANTLALYHLNA